MPIELRWLASTAASSLHAAAATLAGAALVDRATAAAIEDEARGLGDDLAALDLDPARFFEHALGQSVRFDVPRQLVDVVLRKMVGPASLDEESQPLVRRLTALEAAFNAANPRALDELELRAGPLREQWEARGAGLMAGVARRTQGDLLVERADVILVQPVCGGGGAAHWLYNSVRIEAVLTNPIDTLPEVARLGWLLAQLNQDLPKFEGDLPLDRLKQIWPLAMIPPVLAAAEDVELVRADERALATALTAWTTTLADPATLSQWWATYEANRPLWGVALGALERMLADESAKSRS